MKRVRVLLFVMGLIFAISAMGCSTQRSRYSYSEESPTTAPTPTPIPIEKWEVVDEKDEFGDSKGNSFPAVSVIGTFSNTATTNSTLQANIAIYNDNFAIFLWEYCSNEVENYMSYQDTYYMAIKLPDGQKIEGKAYMDSGTKYLWVSNHENDNHLAQKLFDALCSGNYNEKVSVYLENIGKYGLGQNYSFAIPVSNFREVYNQTR